MKSLLLFENDLMFRNGTLALGKTTDQEAELILATNKGNWKEDPLLGANLIELMRSKAGQAGVKQAAKTALTRDNKRVSKIEFTGSYLNVEIEQQ